jgi:hypothetical protein
MTYFHLDIIEISSNIWPFLLIKKVIVWSFLTSRKRKLQGFLLEQGYGESTEPLIETKFVF